MNNFWKVLLFETISDSTRVEYRKMRDGRCRVRTRRGEFHIERFATRSNSRICPWFAGCAPSWQRDEPAYTRAFIICSGQPWLRPAIYARFDILVRAFFRSRIANTLPGEWRQQRRADNLQRGDNELAPHTRGLCYSNKFEPLIL